jgi:hypothetical protein
MREKEKKVQNKKGDFVGECYGKRDKRDTDREGGRDKERKRERCERERERVREM